MEQITLGQIGLAITFVAGIISGVGVIMKKMKDWIQVAMQDQMESIDSKIMSLEKRLDQVDMESCKNYLVQFLSSCEKGTWIDEIEKERFHEQFDHYVKNGGNSYIKQKVESLRLKGNL